MKRLLLVLAVAISAFGQPTTVVISNISGPNSAQKASGTVTFIATQPFTATDGVNVVPSVGTTVTISNGQFTVKLEPTPIGVNYLATYSISGGGKSYTETWNVRPSATALTSINDVRVGSSPFAILPKGAWNSTDTFGPYGIVTYNGSAYIAVAFSTNVIPGTDGTKWLPFVSRGDPGPTGAANNVSSPLQYDSISGTIKCPTCLTNPGRPAGKYCISIDSGGNATLLDWTTCGGATGGGGGGGGGTTLLLSTLTNSQLLTTTNSQLLTLSN